MLGLMQDRPLAPPHVFHRAEQFFGHIRLFPEQLVYIADHAEDEVVFVDRSLIVLIADGAALSEHDVVLPVVAMFHANAWGLPYACLMSGSDVVFPGPQMTPPAAVIAIPHERWVERPLAGVVVEPGETVTGEEIIEFRTPRVAKWWLPDAVEFIDEVPRTSVGKFSEKTLREKFGGYQVTGPATRGVSTWPARSTTSGN